MTAWLAAVMAKSPSPEWLLVAPGVWLTLVLAVCSALILRRTIFGRRVFAIGSNEAAARVKARRASGSISQRCAARAARRR